VAVERERARYEPKIIREFKELGNERNKLRVRLLQFVYPHSISEPKLDIRQYLEDIDSSSGDGTKWSGYTRRGITLSWDDLQVLEEIIAEAKDLMDAEAARPEKVKSA
jgi:hypothetical protein